MSQKSPIVGIPSLSQPKGPLVLIVHGPILDRAKAVESPLQGGLHQQKIRGRPKTIATEHRDQQQTSIQGSINVHKDDAGKLP
jgi:hypothetical protein